MGERAAGRLLGRNGDVRGHKLHTAAERVDALVGKERGAKNAGGVAVVDATAQMRRHVHVHVAEALVQRPSDLHVLGVLVADVLNDGSVKVDTCGKCLAVTVVVDGLDLGLEVVHGAW